jgi:hypothetical protein
MPPPSSETAVETAGGEGAVAGVDESEAGAGVGSADETAHPPRPASANLGGKTEGPPLAEMQAQHDVSAEPPRASVEVPAEARKLP